MADVPPPKRLSNRLHNLPAQLTSFVGRAREKAEVRKLLPTTSCLTLTGSGGAGKTRLALQVAEEVRDEFPDGVWLVELAALMDPRLISKAVATALKVPEEPGRALTETLAEALRLKSALVILDNCEHLVAGCAELTTVLLSACPNVRILATSRQSLGVAGETTWPVPPLSLPAPDRLPPLDRLKDYEAVRLFVERAVAHAPGFALTHDNALAVVQICCRLDGIPLALELAAARITVLSPREIAQRLDVQFHWLRGGPRDALDRHRSLHATIAWSDELLTSTEQRLFRRLAVFRGGFTLESAEAVCGETGGEILDDLSALIDKSLLMRVVAPGETVRFRMLETIREYALQRLAAGGELEDIRHRHAGHFAALAEQTHLDMGSVNEGPSLHRLWQDIDNVRTAVDWALRNSPETAARLGGGLGWVFYHQGHLIEGRERMEQIVRVTTEVDIRLRSAVLYQAGVLAMSVGDWTEARTWLEQSIALSREHGDARREAMATAMIGHVARSRGECDEASQHYERALRVYRQHGDRWGIAWALFDLGLAARDRGHDDEAVALHEQSLALFRTQGIHWGIAWQLWSLGVLAHRRGDDARAREYFAEGLVLYRSLDDRRGIAQSMEGLAAVTFVAGRMRETARVLAAADRIRAGLSARLVFSDHRAYDRMLEGVRASMPAEEFAHQWNTGRSLEPNDAIQLALEAAQLPVARGRPWERSRDPLTSREREVATLIARGLSNREIATQLSIAERTAVSHVEHIMNKLGLHSRAHIAAWAVRHGLDASVDS